MLFLRLNPAAVLEVHERLQALLCQRAMTGKHVVKARTVKFLQPLCIWTGLGLAYCIKGENQHLQFPIHSWKNSRVNRSASASAIGSWNCRHECLS